MTVATTVPPACKSHVNKLDDDCNYNHNDNRDDTLSNACDGERDKGSKQHNKIIATNDKHAQARSGSNNGNYTRARTNYSNNKRSKDTSTKKVLLSRMWSKISTFKVINTTQS